MTKTENNTISFKLNNSNSELKQFIKKILNTILISFIGSIISCSIFFLFLSIFVFNLQIQQNDFSKKDSLMYTYEIVQIDLLKDNLKSYFFEQ